jgi:hypothetical protein
VTTTRHDDDTPIEPGSTFDRPAFQWALGIVLGALIAIGGLVYSSIDHRLSVIEQNGSPMLRERLARVEGDSAKMQNDIREIRSDQKEILQLLREHVEGRAAGR